MLTAERCRDRAAECQQMAEHAPSARIRDILLDVARTWTRLALEAEQWAQMKSTVSAAYQGRSDKCTKGGDQAHPTFTSQLATIASYLVSETVLG